MLATIAEPRPSLKPHVPRIESVKVPMDKIGAIIGPGGKNIRALQEETNTKIDIDEDGTVYIASVDGVGFEEARDRILAVTETAEIGKIYTEGAFGSPILVLLSRFARYGRHGSHFPAFQRTR